jgi:tetratricopeptide (TPR) repeat protein
VTFIAAAAIIPYLNSLSADFTFDDIDIIRDNPAVQIYPARSLLTYVHPVGSLYRPVTMLTYAANASISRDPFGFHLVNVLLHALVAVAVFFLVLRLVRSRSAAVMAGLLFATHPIHTEAVTNVVGRAELLAGLGVLTALLAFARARDRAGTARAAWSAVSIAAFAFGVLAKESALTGVGLIAVLHWWIERRAGVRDRTAALLPYAAVAVAYLVLRSAVVGALGLAEPPGSLDNPLAHVELWSRLRTAAIVLWQYLGLLLLPLHLSADYSFNQVPVAYTWSDPRWLFAAALIATAAALVFALRRRAPVLIIAALFMLIPLALTANVLLPIGTIKAERLLYLPSFGWALACGWLAARAADRRSSYAIAAAALVAVFGARAWIRNWDWRNDTALFAATLLDAPNSAKAHHNAAVALEHTGDLGAATFEYRRALDIYPSYADCAFGLCHIYDVTGRADAALYWCEDALRREPTFTKAHLEIALIRGRLGQLDTAEAAILTGLAIEPRSPLLLVNLSAVELAAGDRWRAGMVLQRLKGIDTLDPSEHEAIAETRGDLEVALQ